MDRFAAPARQANPAGNGEDGNFLDAGTDTGGGSHRSRLMARVNAQFQDQTGRGIVWAPVATASGLMTYYSLPAEPPAETVVIMGAVVIVLSVAAWTQRAAGVCSLAAFLIAGFILGLASTHVKGTKILPGSTGEVTVRGWIQDLELRAGNRRRLVLEVDRILEVKPQYWPGRVRLHATSDHIGTHARGDFVQFRAWLYPPLTPAAPGGWNYGRAGWFEGIGAGGRVATKLVRNGDKQARWAWFDRVAELRAGITERVRAQLPEPESGFAIALITGERGGLDKATREALQLSGLAHILAISGLHMSLVAGGVFWLVRALLALWPFLALTYPIKKFAAFAGLFAAGFYLLISGQAIATQRAFIMLAVMFLAVLLGRSALSMRNLAVAALIVLLLAPHAVLTPSFQMSFLAVGGLIAGYEVLAGRQLRWRSRLAARPIHIKAMLLVVLGLIGLSTTTIIASAFTTLPAAYHFNRFATWALPANLLAMPIVTFAVMPGAVVAVCLMPFGLEQLPLAVMSAGLRGVQAIAYAVSTWPGATKVAGAMCPQMAFMAGIFVCVLALWRGVLRWLGGALAIVLGFAAIALGPRPDILVERTAATLAARMQDGNLVPVSSRRGRFAVQRWLLADGDDAAHPEAARRIGWSCADHVCRSQVAGKSLLWLGRKAEPPEDCDDFDIVVSANPLRRHCGYPTATQLHIDRFDVWRDGAHAIHISADGAMHLKTARGVSGTRAWVYQPVARRKILLNDPGPWIDRRASGAGGDSKTTGQ